jgi:hypothetical protein
VRRDGERKRERAGERAGEREREERARETGGERESARARERERERESARESRKRCNNIDHPHPLCPIPKVIADEEGLLYTGGEYIPATFFAAFKPL